MRNRHSNGNWKGGISLFRTADELLNLGESVRKEVARRLEEQTQTGDGCWMWTGAVFGSNNRACLTIGKTNHLAYRLVYVLKFGPTSGKSVLHSCDNGLCVRPDHLRLGTPADNSRDMVEKRRQAHGGRNARAVLTSEQVAEIRARVGSRKLYGLRKKLAEEYGVCGETISRIIRGDAWRYEGDSGFRL